jgi:iron(III) transport system ATP-binding protein
MRAASIELLGVGKHYGEVLAVDDVSFGVAACSLVTLLGPSGCGKTTILRLIAGLESPSKGSIRIGAVDVTGIPASERDVSMVFQSYALFPHMTVLENVGYGLLVTGVARPERDAKAEAALALVGLTGLDRRLPSELSGGQQQRVAVARALVLEPGVLLFDEPLSNLDARLRRQMREEIRDLQRRLGLTVVYVTHDQAEALAVSDRIIVMNHAAIAQEGSPRELYEAPADAFVAGFMGEATRLRARLTREDDTHGRVAVGPLVVSVVHRGLRDGDVDVVLRPEAVVLRPAGTTPLRGVVRRAAYLGSAIEYSVETPLGALFAVSPAVEQPLAIGAEVAIDLARHGVIAIPAR